MPLQPTCGPATLADKLNIYAFGDCHLEAANHILTRAVRGRLLDTLQLAWEDDEAAEIDWPATLDQRRPPLRRRTAATGSWRRRSDRDTPSTWPTPSPGSTTGTPTSSSTPSPTPPASTSPGTTDDRPQRSLPGHKGSGRPDSTAGHRRRRCGAFHAHSPHTGTSPDGHHRHAGRHPLSPSPRNQRPSRYRRWSPGGPCCCPLWPFRCWVRSRPGGASHPSSVPPSRCRCRLVACCWSSPNSYTERPRSARTGSTTASTLGGGAEGEARSPPHPLPHHPTPFLVHHHPPPPLPFSPPLLLSPPPPTTPPPLSHLHISS